MLTFPPSYVRCWASTTLWVTILVVLTAGFLFGLVFSFGASRLTARCRLVIPGLASCTCLLLLTNAFPPVDLAFSGRDLIRCRAGCSFGTLTA